MTRPRFDSPPGVHGQMKKIANVRGVSTSELYLTATKLIVNIDPESDFDPNDDELLQFYLTQLRE